MSWQLCSVYAKTKWLKTNSHGSIECITLKLTKVPHLAIPNKRLHWKLLDGNLVSNSYCFVKQRFQIKADNCYLDWQCKQRQCWAGALVYWLWEETRVPKVAILNPSTVYWMDTFSRKFVVSIVKFVWKAENKRKRCRGWPILLKETKTTFAFT